MDATPKPGRFGQLVAEFKAGGVTRRQFLARAGALGVGLPIATFVANTVSVAGAPARPNAGWATVHQDGTGSAPAVGMEGKTRGQGGELKILQWQAPTILNPHQAQGLKDQLAAGLVLESPMNFLPDGSLIPTMIEQVPTVENGLLAADLTSFTAKVKDGLRWSDGEPVTADDVVFTWMWITDRPPVVPEGETSAAVTFEIWAPIERIEAVDATSFTVSYATPNLGWYLPLSSGNCILPKHVFDAGPSAAEAFLTGPIGTGPYVVESFTPNDQIVFQANPNYRDPNKPFFQTVNLKGGGDPASAARAVLQTGDWDYAWNIQVEPAVLNELMESGNQGTVVALPGTTLERINLNFSDPNKEVNGERSQKDTPHPILSDPAVRQAMALAVDRETIAVQFYGEGEPAARNVVNGIPAFESPNTTFEYNLEKAAQLLEEAGWVRDGDVRKKGGVELKLTYATSINPVRQKTQQVVKQAFEQIGFDVDLLQVDSGVFFDASPGNEQTIGHMYVDMNMYANGPGTPVAIEFMVSWYAGPNGENIAQKANNWSGLNLQRWANAEYDALYDQLVQATDPEQAAQLVIRMNDLLVNEVVVIPQVNRATDKYAISNRLVGENVALSPFEYNYWNIANWCTVE